MRQTRLFQKRACLAPAGIQAVVGLVSATILAPLGAAWAAPQVRVHGDGDCPSTLQVAAALDYLLKGLTVTPDTVPADLTLEIADQGSRYRVSIAGQAREYEDVSRDCEERARVAAVLAAITLEPPEVGGHARPPEPSPRASHRLLEVRVGAVAEVGPQQAHAALAWGAELRAALSGERWGVELGAGGQSPAGLVFGTYDATITRFPFDLGVRRIMRGRHLLGSWSAGVACAVFYLRGEGSGAPVHDGGTRLDLGLRSGFSLGFLPDARFSPFIALHVSIWPRRYAATVDPVGEVGRLPPVWVGATLGIAMAR